MIGKLSSQIIRDVPYAVITLVSYEFIQSMVNKNRNSSSKDSYKLMDALCGSIAGGLLSL